MTKNFSNRCLSLLWAALTLSVGAALGPARAAGGDQAAATPKPIHFHGVILTPGGQPAPNATIVFYLVDNDTRMVSSEQTLHPTATGAFDIPWTWDPKVHRFPVIYVTAPEGIALPDLSEKEMRVTLDLATSVQVHLLDDSGKPIAHVRVCPQSFTRDHSYGSWDEAIQDRLSAVTDETGAATLTGLPQGWSMRLHVADPRYVQPGWNQNISLAKAAVTPDATVKVSPGGSLSGVVVFGPTKQPAPNIGVSASPVSEGGERQSAFTDADGKYRMPSLPVGSYNLSVTGSRNTAMQEWTAVQQSAAVTAGSDTSGINFTLIHGGVLTGTVTDPKTGQPIPQVGVFVLGPGGDQNARTGDDGRYTLHLPPGNQRVILESEPGMTPDEQQFVDLAEGETKTVNFKSTAPVHPAVMQGVVIGPSGQPVAGAQVTAAAQSQQEQDTKQTTDAQGKFTFDKPGLMPDMRLYAAAGEFATSTGTLAASGRPLTLRLAANANVVIRGQVIDPDGRALSGASVMLFRQHPVGIGGIGIDTTKTDAAGRYAFTPVVPDAIYSAGVQATGFGYQFTKQVKGVAGKPLNLAALTLPRADSFVGGTVVDVNGKPIAGADVSFMSAGDAHTLTDKQGKFHLAGATRGKVILEVRAANGRFASIQIASGHDDNTITAENQNEQAAESKRFVTARDADPTNHGNGAKAAVLLHTAFSQASQGRKKVLLVFHASWCGPCFLLHRFLRDPQVQPVIASHFITQDIDIWENKPTKAWENPSGDVLYKKYGGFKSPGHAQGVPFFVVLNASGRKLGDARMNGENIGFPYDAGTTDFFLKTLKAAAPEMTGGELAILKAGLQRDAKI